MNANGVQSNIGYPEVQQMWNGINRPIELDLNISSQFLHFSFLKLLDLSPCVTWILDIRTQQYNFITNNTIDIFGFESENYRTQGRSFHESTIHPDDKPKTWKLMQSIWKVLSIIPFDQVFNYKFSHDYRIVKPDGKTVRILEQNSVLQQDANGNITHLLGVCHDITQWKKTGAQIASLSSAIYKQYFLFTPDNTSNIKPKTILSKRELEIVKLISEGHSSKFIADKLFISFHTVNTHRQKMIEKTNTKNTGGLVQFAVCNGLI